MTGFLSTVHPLGVLLIYFLLHLFTGMLLPRQDAQRPLFWALMQNASLELDRRLNRAGRTVREKSLRGTTVAVLMGIFSVIIGCAVARVELHAYGWLLSLVFLCTTVSVFLPMKILRAVELQLEAKKTQQAADILKPYMRDESTKWDQHTIMRRALELGAVRLNQYFVAPVFYFIFAQGIGLAIYVTFAALDEVMGVPDTRHRHFGRTARMMADVLNYIPARLTALLIAMASLFVSRSSLRRSMAIAWRQSRHHCSASRGWPIGALAGGLGVTLGGPARHSESFVEPHGWIGPEGSSAQLSVEDLRRGGLMIFVAFLCGMALVSLIIMH